MKPVLKWAGGKARLADRIAAVFGESCRGTYFEPFLGSGAVFLRLKAAKLIRKAVLSDVNAKLIAVHVALRDHLAKVFAHLDEMPRDDWRERYYDVRERFNEGPHRGPAHAARFLWLNRTGYNGLYRENRKGKYNVPVGRYKAVRLPSRDHFRQVSELLAGTELCSLPFEEVIANAKGRDQVYCDPPYVPLDATSRFTDYCALPFGHEQQLALADSSRQAAGRGAHVVLSNHDLPIVRDEIYPVASGFRHVQEFDVRRAISCGKRRRVGELLADISPESTGQEGRSEVLRKRAQGGGRRR
ncbi:MAG: Dam family site-specific DNA-(adenine-N6)-methyltransferase [Myxococcota bacterium]